jgi:hypothetical protein
MKLDHFPFITIIIIIIHFYAIKISFRNDGIDSVLSILIFYNCNRLND